jgi:hypothetical protein
MSEISIAPHRAKVIVKQFLDDQQLPYTKLTARTIGFSDIARTNCLFVKIHGWQPNPLFDDIRQIAKDHSFRVEADGLS